MNIELGVAAAIEATALVAQRALGLLQRAPGGALLLVGIGGRPLLLLGVLRVGQLVRRHFPGLVKLVQLLDARRDAAAVRQQLVELGAHTHRLLLPLVEGE